MCKMNNFQEGTRTWPVLGDRILVAYVPLPMRGSESVPSGNSFICTFTRTSANFLFSFHLFYVKLYFVTSRKYSIRNIPLHFGILDGHTQTKEI